MLPVRLTRRAAAAAATVLAVTLGAGALTVPAAASDEATAAGTQEAVTRVALNYVVDEAGTAGFFDSLWFNEGVRAWTSYKDGRSYSLSRYTKSVSVVGGNQFVDDVTDTVVDMATGARYQLPDGNTLAIGIAGPYVFTALATASGPTLWAHTAEGSRQVTGLPAGAKDLSVRPGTAAYGVVAFTGADGERHQGLVDLAAGKVTEDYAVPASASSFTFSDTRVAWAERDAATGTARAVLVDRKTAGRKTVDLGRMPRTAEVQLMGDWLLDGLPLREGRDLTPGYGLRARNLADGSAPVKLLDHFQTMTRDTGGGVLASGGRLGKGEGVHRIERGADGRPAVTLVASNGSPTETAQLRESPIPELLDLDQRRYAWLWWSVNHWDTKATVRLRHVRTGKTYDWTSNGYRGGRSMDGNISDYSDGFSMGPSSEWRGTFGTENELGSVHTGAAYNGDYTWEFTAEPLSGLGPALKRSGTFTLVRSPKQHDFDDNGSPDVLARDASGVLRSDTSVRRSPWSETEVPETTIGGGWQIYDRIETVGDVAGSVHADVIARDAAGVLWLYQGDGNGGFARRVQVGGGWQTYERITGGSDFTGDGRPDVVAVDKAGDLWLYKATGSATKPFDARKKVSSGWGGYDQLTATGNIAGAAHGDLVTRDADGVTWMFLGKGDGTFTAPTRLREGFGRYSKFLGAGDYDADGRNDLLAVEAATGRTYLFRGTGGRTTPFERARIATSLFSSGSYDLFG
ncbi:MULTISPECIES: VCBS repeat-containing protein [unclassified Streptomyces]|uniref:FG-GAP repeat domain-containing protein n=1 Tax=unclassified Streptomyces TaxID=2593676 RepID=UPI0033210F04